MDLLFKNITIVTMDDEEFVIENGYLGIQGEKIVYLSKEKPNIQANREIDGKGKVIMPGLINCHTHIPMSILRGYADDYELQDWLFNHIFKAEAKMDDKCVELGALLTVAEMVSTGTTSITDMYINGPVVAEVIKNTGIRANICNGNFCFTEKYDHLEDKGYRQFMEIVEKYHNYSNGRIKIDVGIHGEYTSTPEFWTFWAKKAKEYNLNMHLHLSETELEHENCKKKYGKTPTEILIDHGVFDTQANLAHCVWLEEKDMKLIVEKNASVCHNPVSNLKLASGIADTNKMMEMGVNVCLGTDGVASNNTHDLFEELKLSAILAKGKTLCAKTLPAKEALKLATINGAKSQNRDNIGMVKIGYDADLIMVDFSNISHTPVYDVVSSLVYNTIGRDVLLTMVQGKILYENGKFTTIDIEKVKEEINSYVIPKLKG
ncbi:MAG: amidohydrolase [Cetobacterium sp.]|uniref:amidohydrolase n=1 Tax=Cetobacterium sp. TaxID=2071632 RepID=UPI003F40F1B6